MCPRFSLFRLLAALAVIGIVLGPIASSFVAPAMAEGMQQEMTGSMQDCPEGKAARTDCGKDCLLTTLCVTSFAFERADSVAATISTLVKDINFPTRQDPTVSSPISGPPPKPPMA